MARYDIDPGVTSTGIELSYNDSMFVSSAGKVNDTVLAGSRFIEYTNMYVLQGGSAVRTTVNFGRMNIDNGGYAQSTTLNSNTAILNVYSGAHVNTATVKNGAVMYLSAGGSATNINIDSTGKMSASITSNTYITGTSNGKTVKVGDGITSNITLYYYCYMDVASGWVAKDTVLAGSSFIEYTNMNILQGGSAVGTTVNFGTVNIANEGYAQSTTLNSNTAVLKVAAGGHVDTTTVKNGAVMYLAAGGSATNLNIGSTGIMSASITSNTYITGTSNGKTIKVGDKVTSNITLYYYCYMDVSSGWVAKDTVLAGSSFAEYTNINILQGGSAVGTTVNFGTVNIANEGYAKSTTLNSSKAVLKVAAGGHVDTTTVKNGAVMYLTAGGSATNLNIGSTGRMEVDVTSNTYITGTSNGKTIKVGDGVISNITLYYYCYMNVSSGWVAKDTVLAGNTFKEYTNMNILQGGRAVGTTVNFGTVNIANEGCHSGALNISNNGRVLAAVGANIDFTVADREASSGALITNYNLISGSAQVNYSITIDSAQKNGIYQLASGASSYAYTATVKNTVGTQLGTLAVGGTLKNGNYTYALSLDSGILSLNVSGGSPTPTPTTDVRTNLLENGYSQIVAWDAEKGKVGYVATNGQTAPAWAGIWEWGENEAAMWKVVAVGHFSNDVKKDGVLLYNGIGNTFAAWTDLGRGDYGYVSLCHVDGNFQTLTLADFDGNGLDDVIIYDEKGSFGIVSDAASYHDVWHVDNPLTNVQQVIGAGYFGNADGKSDILVKNTATDAYYLWHNEDPTFNTWNWSQTHIGTLDDDWVVAAIGDFQGDGIDDIIMWQKSTGFMYAWEDGKVSNQRWVGALDPSDWEVAAVGDYNGDGKEDLLLRELNSGWGGVGYWAGANASNWTDLNARIETDMESKFAVVA